MKNKDLQIKKKDNHFLAFNNRFFVKNQKCLLILFNLIYKIFHSLLFKSKETDDFNNNKIIEVGNNHATCDAGLRYFKKSDLIKTASENPEFNHKERRIYRLILRKMKQGKIKEELKLLPARKTVFFTDWNYSKMLYNAFKPMWWAMHYWDELFADRFAPALSFQFSTLTQYPGSIGVNNPADGIVKRNQLGGSWSQLQSGAGTSAENTSDSNYIIWIRAYSNDNTWLDILRSIFLYDTSSLTAGATISTAIPPILSLYGIAKANTLTSSPDLDIYTSTPNANNNLVAGDYTQIQGVSQTGNPITYAEFNTAGYNEFTFNATGIGNVSKTSISRFGARNANWDVANSAPPWGSFLQCEMDCYLTGHGSNKPKLVVTYTVATTSGGFFLLRK